MHPAPTSPLGQAFAAFFAILIAAIAEHAAEHPLLAPGLRASIRRLEKLSRQLQAMAADWEASQAESNPTVGPASARHAPATRPDSDTATPYPLAPLPIPIRNRATAPRAPPTPNHAQRPKELPRKPLRPGARRMYPYPCRSNTTAPPRIVMSAFVANSSSTGPAKMSRDRIATSAICPATSRPRPASANWV